MNRYNHWFWNSKAFGWAEGKVVRLSCWMWKKQYDR